MSKINKLHYIGWFYVGDTAIDVRGHDGDFEELYISDTEINVTEMIYQLVGDNRDDFENKARIQIFG